MKKMTIRLLWPQEQAEIGQWQCEYIRASATDNNPDVDMVVLADILPSVFASQSQGFALHVIVPAEIALFERVVLPARNQRQALQALPFLVEEQLADDVENTHLAVGRKLSDGSWPVLAINTSWMQSLLNYLQGHGIQPNAVYVDANMLATKDSQLCIIMHASRVLLRSHSIAVAIDIANAPLVMQLLENFSAYRFVDIYLDPDNEKQQILAQQWATEFAALEEIKTTIEPLTTQLSSFLSAEMAGINLLQGRFFFKQKSEGLSWWHVGIAAVLLLVIGQTTLQLTSGWYFNGAAEIAERSAEDQYRKLFPSARQVSDPRKRLASRLAEAGSSNSSDSSFVTVFGSSVQALNSVADAGITIQQLRYDGKRAELGLDLKAGSIEQIDKFKQALMKRSLQADIDSANESEEGVLGSIKIRAGA